MKNYTLYFLCACLLSAGCAKQNAQQEKVLAEVNDFQLSQEEFKRQLAAELEFDEDFKMTLDAKKHFLSDLIEKELLIQEARKLKLDRKEKFIRSIERYWESTLIRNLLDLKGAEIDKATVIDQAEVAAYYNELKQTDPSLPPLGKIQDALQDDLKEKKKRLTLQKWIRDIKKNADIKIHDNLL